MILIGGKHLKGPEGVINDVNLHDKSVVIETEVSNPSNVLHDDVVNDANKLPKDLKQTFREPFTMPLRFPQRMANAKLDLQFGKFLKVLKKLYITIPFIDSLSQMSSYAKFLKEILSNKRNQEEHEIVALTKECSATIQNKPPAMFKDLSCFSIPCLIGNVCVDCALYDLGSSVSLMPIFMCEKLDL